MEVKRILQARPASEGIRYGDGIRPLLPSAWQDPGSVGKCGYMPSKLR